jgi:hypothetical protein
VYGDYLQYRDRDRGYRIHEYGDRSGLPIVAFTLDAYWGTHYRNQRWYGDRDRWNSGGHHHSRDDGRRERYEAPRSDDRDQRDRRDHGDRHDHESGSPQHAPAFQGGPQANAPSPPRDPARHHEQVSAPIATATPAAAQPAPASDNRAPTTVDRERGRQTEASNRDRGHSPPAGPADPKHAQGSKPQEPREGANKHKRDDSDPPSNDANPH